VQMDDFHLLAAERMTRMGDGHPFYRYL
jgi:hypothetical protein